MVKYPVTLKWSEHMENYCVENNIYLAHPRRIRGIYQPNDPIRINGQVLVEPYSTSVRHNFFSIGAFSYANTHLPYDTRIGRYCSIAPRVEVMTAQHPTTRFSTSPITYHAHWSGFAAREFQKIWETEAFNEMPPPPVVCNDVWIGQDVLIKGGVIIGNGACIAAGAVVTKDVPPFAIFGGVPAKLIRYRFPERQRERLAATQWWQYRFVDLPDCKKDDIDRFTGELEELVAHGLKEWTPGMIDLGEVFVEIARAAAS